MTRSHREKWEAAYFASRVFHSGRDHKEFEAEVQKLSN
jgi:hypothetical protein